MWKMDKGDDKGKDVFHNKCPRKIYELSGKIMSLLLRNVTLGKSEQETARNG